ncbi:MAG: trypsin-like peptidase domain-containing protein [Magnetococcales bacterium]|nr:trypsin-like peptidase domain-containing protein [Magnetococcales bacterium]
MNSKDAWLRSSMHRKPLHVLGAIVVCILIGLYWYSAIQRKGVGLVDGQGRIPLPAFNAPGVQPAAFVTPVATGGRTFANAVQGVMPGIVDVSATRNEARNTPLARPLAPGLQFSNPFGDKPLESVGSGLIVSTDGYVVTNYHVVENAHEVWITLFNPDGTTNRHDATIVRADKKRELALLKIQANRVLQPVPFGASETMLVGEGVIAIGTPFGLSQSVSQGILSSKRNTVTIEGQVHKELLQTDAAINQGNSGGPLVNRRGEVIGLNTAIYTTTGSFSGIGFAIPSERVLEFLEESMARPPLMARRGGDPAPGPDAGGRPVATPAPGGAVGISVARTPATTTADARWLGLDLLPMDPARAKQLDIPDTEGALVQAVLPSTPAAEAGFVTGDLIFKFNGRRIRTPQEFLKRLSAGEIENARVSIIRQGKRQNLRLTLAGTPPSYVRQQANTVSGAVSVAVAAPVVAAQPQTQTAAPAQNEFEWMGMEIAPIDAAMRAKNRGLDNTSGALVIEVNPGTPAETAGMQAGDVILAINNQPAIDANTLNLAIRGSAGGKTILLEVGRNNKRMFATLM